MELTEWLQNDHVANDKDAREHRQGILRSIRISYDSAREALAVIDLHDRLRGGGYITADSFNAMVEWYGRETWMQIGAIERKQMECYGSLLLGGRSPLRVEGTFFRIEDGQRTVHLDMLRRRILEMLNVAFGKTIRELVEAWFNCSPFNHEAITHHLLVRLRPQPIQEDALFRGVDIDRIVPELEVLEQFYKRTLKG